MYNTGDRNREHIYFRSKENCSEWSQPGVDEIGYEKWQLLSESKKYWKEKEHKGEEVTVDQHSGIHLNGRFYIINRASCIRKSIGSLFHHF